MPSIRIGTRGSALARAQAELVARLLQREAGVADVQVVPIGVSGDAAAAEAAAAAVAQAPDRSGDAGSPGAPTDKRRWVDRIEQALIDGRVDLAVHSAKDVPGELGAGLALVGAPAREDARDALCGAASLAGLAPGAAVGTGSVRRTALLLALREDLDVRPVRGNVDTRLRRLDEGAFDALLLAMAGLRRLGRAGAAGAALDADEFVPAPGQGILALQARADDEHAAQAAAAISDRATVAALAAERALVAGLNASCHTPVGAHARGGENGTLTLVAFVGLPDGSAWVRDRHTGQASDPEGLGRDVAQRMLTAGAGDLLARAEREAGARV